MNPDCPADQKERILRELRTTGLVTWTLILSGWSSAFTPIFAKGLGPGISELLVLLGWLLCLAGAVAYVRLRNRGWAWSLLGLSGCLAPFLLSMLHSKCRHCGEIERGTRLNCWTCDAPL